VRPPRVVAIDGAAGSGKSTLARALAIALGLAYVNTGSMYRALTGAALRAGIDLEDEEALVRVIDGLRFALREGSPPELEVEGWTTEALTAPEVEAEVSRAARHPAVRRVMRMLQRGFGQGGGAVMEGRDIGTVVFPEAPVKIFLSADPVARGSRRLAERSSDHAIVWALHARDEQDARVNPLEPAEDAVVIDTTELSAEQTLERALEIVRDRLP
jgi:cytidylate kinase